MSPTELWHALLNHLPWLPGGLFAGYLLVPLARITAEKVLLDAEAPLEEWRGPGGGLNEALPPARRIWVPLLNAGLWICLANSTSDPAFLSRLPGAGLASALILLALIDWDTTLLPDRIVLPLGISGLAASYAGLTPQNLPESAASGAVVAGIFGGLAWLYRRRRGEDGIGGGDIKLLAALGAWWGLLDVLYMVVWASVGTVVWYAVWRWLKRPDPDAEWPFGPAIAAAALVWSLLAAYSH